MVILIGQDGVQRPPIRFPTTGSLLSFLNCLENGLHPNGELDPPLFNPRSKGLGLPRLKRPPSGDNVLLSALSKGDNQDYVFRLVSGTKPEDLGMQFFYFQKKKNVLKVHFGLNWLKIKHTLVSNNSSTNSTERVRQHSLHSLSAVNFKFGRK